MAYDGIQFGQRVDGTTERKLHAKVIDSMLNSRTYFSRLVSQGRPMLGKTYDVTHKVSRTGQGQYFVGLEPLNISAWNTKVTASFAHAAYSHPVPSIMQEAFANAGSTGTIDLDTNNLEEAKAEMLQDLGADIYSSLGTSNKPMGLEGIIDDGTNLGTIGGVSRTTYTQFNAYVSAASGGTMSLARLATVYDGASAAGYASEEPNIGVTTKAIWAYQEQLIAPQMRNNYKTLPIMAPTSDTVSRQEISGTLGFNCVYFRGIPIIKDDACTTGVMYFINEQYIQWMGRTIAPDNYSDVKKVDLGTAKTFDGVAGLKEYMPSEANGFWYTPFLMMPTAAGKVARYYMFGQLIPLQFRRHGKLTGITGI